MLLKRAIEVLQPVKALIDERDALIKANGTFPAGHFYSPVVSIREIEQDEARIFVQPTRLIPGIELNEQTQLELLIKLEQYYSTVPFSAAKIAGSRYYYDNPHYSYSDAIFLHCMIRHLSPRMIVEVGSGFSSCATLDTNEKYFGNRITTVFIEPYPQLLHSLISDDDRQRVHIIPERLQDIDLGVFTRLQPNDVLFIDSTHVSKTGSDVNCLFFHVLPALNSGVYIHIHDIFFPFEYPKEWVLGGRSWNEIYLLRSFLQYNQAFEIVLMNTFLEHFHEARFQETMPLCLVNRGGSIWLRKK